MVSIRPAGVRDAAAIRAVARESWHAAYDDFLGVETVERTIEKWYDLEGLREAIAADDGHVFLATAETIANAHRDECDPSGDPDHQAVVGFVHVKPGEDAATARLLRLYVCPRRWGEGIGRALLERAETALERDGFERLTLEVFAANEVGVGFYEATGFERVGTHEEPFAGERHRVVSYEKTL